MTPAVVHDAAGEKFFIALPEGECVLDYRKIDDSTLEYYHTFVPPALRGRGLAAILVQYALDYAKNNGLKVIPSCSYVRAYIERNHKTPTN